MNAESGQTAASGSSGASGTSGTSGSAGASGPQGQYGQYQVLLDQCRGAPPCRTAVVHPCDAESLHAAMAAQRAGLIAPILVGPKARIEALADKHAIDISGFTIAPTPHSHGSAAEAVRMARSGEVEVLMKGCLHTDELMAEVVSAANGLRTARRISHCFVMDVPSYPRLLIITDAAINIVPSLAEKVDIVQNAIDLARVLGFDPVRVAVLSAMETVNPEIRSTIEAAALCKMAERGQITGALIDGPLALDNAISFESMRIKQIDSPVAGCANVLMVPDLEAGNMLAKSLSFMAGAQAAGIVVGARVPVILPSRADSAASRLAASAVAALLAIHRRQSVAAAIV